MKKPFFSIIIPAFNSEKTIGKCLRSVFDNSFKDFEIIVVDDCSVDSTLKIIKQFDCRIIRLKKNSGPANARNIGVKKAAAEVIFFLDSDVILKRDVLEVCRAFYKKNKDAAAVIGRYEKEPANRSLFSHYMAYWNYYTEVMPCHGFFSFFKASIGSIKKEVFLGLKGFDVRYKGADVEDYEFGHRLSRDYRIWFEPDLSGYHHFPGFNTVIKNYSRRASHWFELFLDRRKFDSGAANSLTGFSFLFPAFSLCSGFIGILLMNPLYLIFAAIFSFIFLIFHLRFYFFCLKEKGLFFSFYAYILTFILALIVVSAVCITFIRLIFCLIF